MTWLKSSVGYVPTQVGCHLPFAPLEALVISILPTSFVPSFSVILTGLSLDRYCGGTRLGIFGLGIAAGWDSKALYCRDDLSGLLNVRVCGPGANTLRGSRESAEL